ncbi:hypothetical protein EPN28_03385 [Patescibacteria group bacterium]|nr:MAG: hypothetical protein EPN28_03385 [Patescibacteria group bacterium]
MFFFKPKSFLGIDIGAGGIKLAELRQEKKRPVLFTYGLTSQSQDVHQISTAKEDAVSELLKKKIGAEAGVASAEATAAKAENFSEEKIKEYAAKIAAVCRASRVVSKSAVVSLPVSSVFHAVVTLPLVKKEELDRILRAEIKKFVPIPLEEVAIEHEIISADEEQKIQRVLINAVPHQLISFYTRVFQKAGIALSALEPESAALTRSLVWRDQAVCMLIDIGAERTNFFIVDSAYPVTHQTIDAGGVKIDKILRNALGIDEGGTEQIKRDLFDFVSQPRSGVNLSAKLLEMFGAVIEPIIKEVEVSFELYLRQTGNENKRPEKIILTGGMAGLPYLAKIIADKFKTKCYVGDPWARVVHQDSLRPILQDIGPRMSVAIGLALRNMV